MSYSSVLSAGSDAAANLCATIELANQFDTTLKFDGRNVPRLLRRYVPPLPFSRNLLFERMLKGEPSVLAGFPVPARGPILDPSADTGLAIMSWLERRRSREKHRVFVGPKKVPRRLTLGEIAKAWRAQRTPIGVTDLHIRDTNMEEIIDPDTLSEFNILRNASEAAQAQEMFSFVISSRGYVTDSHSDDPDSTNFCFAGKKLWLAWDTHEGLRRGLDDLEHVSPRKRASFDMETWLSLRSARWFLVTSNDTLFLPANLTHKVITLEPYVGVGGFFVALPNCLRVLSHWIIRGPLWSKADPTGRHDNLVADIAESVRDTIKMLHNSPDERQRWGYDYLHESAEHFIGTCAAGQLRRLQSDPRFRCIADSMGIPWPYLKAQA